MCMVFYLLPISFVAQLVERTAYSRRTGPTSLDMVRYLDFCV